MTGFGVGLNVSTELGWWGRMVGCGLVGKGVANMEVVLQREIGVEEMARVWAREFERGLFGGEGVVEEMGREEKGMLLQGLGRVGSDGEVEWEPVEGEHVCGIIERGGDMKA